MAQLKTIRVALAERVGTLPDLVVYEKIPDGASFPCVIIRPDSPGIEYQQAYRSTNADWRLALIVLAGRTDMEAAQDLLDDYISPDGASSIPAKIAEDDTLGGVVGYAVATQLSKYGEFAFGANKYIGAQIDVEVNI